MDYAYLSNLYGYSPYLYGGGHDEDLYGGGDEDDAYWTESDADDYDDIQYGGDYYYQDGGADFTPEECRAWLADNFVNPRTGRKIGPTASGRGVYHDLHKACMEAGYKLQTPAPVLPQPIKSTPSGAPIMRSATSGSKTRKGPLESATSFPIGTKKANAAGEMYIVSQRSNGQYWQPCSQKTANC